MTAPQPTAEALARYGEHFSDSTAMRHLGARISFPGDDTVLVTVDPVRPEHQGGLGTDAVNGGVLAALFDVALGCSAALVDPTRRSATVQLSMSFMRATRGRTVTVRSKIARASDTLLFAEAKLFDEQGLECAQASGVVRLSTQKWASGTSPSIG